MNKRKVIKRVVIPVSLCATVLLSYSAKKLINNDKDKIVDPNDLSYSDEYESTTNNFEEKYTVIDQTKEYETQATVIQTEKQTEEETKNKEIKNTIDSKIEKLCKDNNYSELVCDSTIEMFHIIESNYDNYYDLFKDDGYLTLNAFEDEIINRLSAKNPQIDLYTDEDANASKYDEILNDYGAVGVYLPNQNRILMNVTDPDVETYMFLFEEYLHSIQYQINNSQEKTLIHEGEAGMYRQLFNETVTNDYGTFCQMGNETIVVNGLKSGRQCYSGRYYQMLCYLIGYDNMFYLKDDYNAEKLINIIESKYDINANILLYLMKDCENPSYNNLFKVENIFCECLKQDAQKLSSYEEVEKFINKYDYYKNQYQLQCNNIENYVNYNEVENIITEKCSEYSVNNELYSSHVRSY